MRDLARLSASRLSNKVVVLTERDARAWQKKYRIKDRVQAIWNPTPRFSKNDTPSLCHKDGAGVALAVGRLTRQKGFDILLQAWSQIGAARKGWVLRIVGSGEEASSLKALSFELGIDDSVVFVGQVHDVASEYCAASMFVMSSRWEGLPMTLLEAQYFGLPIVSTDCPTGPNEVLSGGSGSLVESENPQALADGLSDLMGNTRKREEMALLATENAKKYQPEVIRKEWEAMFVELGL